MPLWFRALLYPITTVISQLRFTGIFIGLYRALQDEYQRHIKGYSIHKWGGVEILPIFETHARTKNVIF